MIQHGDDNGQMMAAALIEARATLVALAEKIEAMKNNVAATGFWADNSIQPS